MFQQTFTEFTDRLGTHVNFGYYGTFKNHRKRRKRNTGSNCKARKISVQAFLGGKDVFRVAGLGTSLVKSAAHCGSPWDGDMHLMLPLAPIASLKLLLLGSTDRKKSD